MTLKLTVKPGETFFVGTTEIDIGCDSIRTVFVTGDAPVLRCEDHIAAEDATTTAERLHYLVQQMYLTRDFDAYYAEYFALAQKLIEEDPTASHGIAEVNRLLIKGSIYKAIKLIKRMGNRNSHTSQVELRLAGVH